MTDAKAILAEYVLQTFAQNKTGEQALDTMDVSDVAFVGAAREILGVELDDLVDQ